MKGDGQMKRKKPIVNPFFHEVSKLVKSSGDSVETLAGQLVAKAKPQIIEAARTGTRVVRLPLGKLEHKPSVLKKALRNSGLDGFWVEVDVNAKDATKSQVVITLPKK
jgi:hypothetical protein